jgi:hypothetical protein
MSYTKFGEYVRILRIKHHEIMGDMAEFLETSLPFLSAVENGKKNVPKSWVEKISTHYNLNENERKELEESIEESKTQMKISLTDISKSKRGMALQFARSFENIDDETAEKIRELLEKGNGI